MFLPVRDVTVAIRQPPNLKEALPEDVELLDQLMVYSPHCEIITGAGSQRH